MFIPQKLENPLHSILILVLRESQVHQHDWDYSCRMHYMPKLPLEIITLKMSKILTAHKVGANQIHNIIVWNAFTNTTQGRQKFINVNLPAYFKALSYGNNAFRRYWGHSRYCNNLARSMFGFLFLCTILSLQ